MFANHAAAWAAQPELSGDAAERAVYWRELYSADPGAFQRAAEAAYADRDHEAVIAATAVLEGDGRLGEGWMLRRVRALNDLERFDEAARLAEALNARARPSAKAHLHWALALAGAGRLAEASRAAQAGARLGLSNAKNLADRLERALEPLPSEPRWTDLKRYAEALVAAGARDLARALIRQVAENPPPFSRKKEFATLAVATLAVDLLPHEEAQRFLDGLEAMGASPDGLAILRAQVTAGAREAAGDYAGAARILSSLANTDGETHDIRHALTRTAGLAALQAANWRPAAPGPRRKIINILPFYDEFAMLDLRLAEMGDWVDRFVIVEARQTFTGLPKPLHFQDAKAAYAHFGDKIAHVVVDEFPEGFNSAWARDYYQRDIAVAALGDYAAEDDLVLITDADEILRRSAVEGFAGEFARVDLRRFQFFLNLRPTETSNTKRRIGPAGVIVKARHLLKYGASYLRFSYARYGRFYSVLDDAGWHFMSAKPASDLVRKYAAYAHQERRGLVTHDQLTGTLARIRAGEPPINWERCAVDDSFPAYVRARPAALADLIL